MWIKMATLTSSTWMSFSLDSGTCLGVRGKPGSSRPSGQLPAAPSAAPCTGCAPSTLAPSPPAWTSCAGPLERHPTDTTQPYTHHLTDIILQVYTTIQTQHHHIHNTTVQTSSYRSTQPYRHNTTVYTTPLYICNTTIQTQHHRTDTIHHTYTTPPYRHNITTPHRHNTTIQTQHHHTDTSLYYRHKNIQTHHHHSTILYISLLYRRNMTIYTHHHPTDIKSSQTQRHAADTLS